MVSVPRVNSPAGPSVSHSLCHAIDGSVSFAEDIYEVLPHLLCSCTQRTVIHVVPYPLGRRQDRDE